jgi:hypothetical protein
MDPISNVDRLVRLLRARLDERAKASRTERRAPQSDAQGAEKPDPLSALAAAEGVPQRALKRALIEHILADHFGHDLINEARFQQVTERVAETLESDPASDALMTRLVKELRSSAR